MKRWSCLSALLFAWSTAGAAETACARFEPAITRLDGRLILRDYAGPPNYGSVADGDRLERQWILILDRPLCVAADPDSEINREAVRAVGEVQLVVMPTSGVRAEGHRGRRIGVEGRLFTAHTGHHRTPVLLVVRSFTPAVAQRADRTSHPEPSP